MTMSKESCPEQESPQLVFDERCERLALVGDIDGVWRTILNAPWGVVDLKPALHHLLHSMEVASFDNPSAVAETLFQKMLSFTSMLVVRSQYYVTQQIAPRNQESGAQELLSQADEAVKVAVPHLLDLHRHLAEIAELQARTARYWRLASQRRGETNRSRRPKTSIPEDEDGYAIDPDGDIMRQFGDQHAKKMAASRYQEVTDGGETQPDESGDSGGAVAQDPTEDSLPCHLPGEAGDDRFSSGVG